MKARKRFYTIIISVIVLLGFLSTSLIGYFVARDSIADRLQQEMLPLSSDNIYSEIQRDLLQPVLISSLMANDTFVIEWVSDGEKDAAKMQRYLKQIQEQYQTITAFFISEKSRLYYHPDGIIKQVSEQDEADGWYFRARNMKQDYEINIDSDTADLNRLSIFVNYRVQNKQGDFIGVIGVGLSMETVTRLIENYQQRYGREIYFVNRQGEVMLQSTQYSHELHLQNKDGLEKLFTRILTSPSASVSFEAKNGNVIYLNSRLVPEFDWFLIIEQINDPASEKVEAALIINLLISLAMSIIVLLVAHLALKGYQGRLEKMATRDKLTGAVTRQVFDSLFEQAISRSRRHQQKTTLALIDIDHFKQVNDTFGHQQGDKVLVAVAQIIKLHIRDADVLCRWGGEEFLLLLNECDLEHAVERLESVRRAIAAWRFHMDDSSLTVTVSAGLAEHEAGESLAGLVERADKALYLAKDKGRNCLSTTP